MALTDRGWSRAFDDPVPLPAGGELRTLLDAAAYITKLPEHEHDTPEWQAATQALLLLAEHGGSAMMARIGGHAGAASARGAQDRDARD